jgi:hypothetical protein
MTNARSMSPEEEQAFVTNRYHALVTRGLERGHFYNMTADGIMLNDRPDYAQAYYDGLQGMRAAYGGSPHAEAAELVVESLGHLPMYILYGWETGIYNEFRHFQGRGFTKANIMEMVMFAQLSAGIRGLQHVYNAVAKLLVDFVEVPIEPAFPEGWAADPGAFKAGLDLSVRPLTDQDRKNIEAWHDEHMGYLPNSVSFAMTYHPEFYKWHRARWEVIFQTLPKQVMPYIMLRQNMIAGNPDALRDAVSLGKSWGITREWLIHGLTISAYYTGFEALHWAHHAVDDILRDMQ